MEMNHTPAFIQIVAVGNTMYALGSDGFVYGYNDSKDEWFVCGVENENTKKTARKRA
jgi:hypothetical protein